MHELDLATEMLRVCRGQLQGRPARIEKVVVAVGELAAVEPDLLRYAWEAITLGTTDEGSRLEVEWHVARQSCAACGDVPERAAGTWLRLCPRCEQPLRLDGGDQLDVMRLSFTPLDDEVPAP